MNNYERVWANIDLDAIRFNMEQMHQNISPDTKMMGVIKTDAYGHGAVQIAKELEQMDFVFGMALATAEEAFILRHCGIKKPLLILGYTFPYAYPELIKNEIRMSVFKEDMLDMIDKEAEKQNKKAIIHIKVDTAMSRIGIKPNEEGVAFIKKCLSKRNIFVEGIFTHFAKADELDKTAVTNQLHMYQAFLSNIARTVPELWKFRMQIWIWYVQVLPYTDYGHLERYPNRLLI